VTFAAGVCILLWFPPRHHQKGCGLYLLVLVLVLRLVVFFF
jgi:hypothetical protein